MRPAMFVAVLIVMQISLGIGTWLVKYSWPTWLPGGQHFAGFTVQAESLVQAITVTAHVAVGSLLLATLVLFSLRCTRLIRVASSSKQPATTRIGVERLLEVVA